MVTDAFTDQVCSLVVDGGLPNTFLIRIDQDKLTGSPRCAVPSNKGEGNPAEPPGKLLWICQGCAREDKAGIRTITLAQTQESPE